jgi:hypothetical protein
MTRLLSPSMMNAFKSGTLAPLLEVIHRDRDLILDIRDDKADIYCKGQVVVHVEPSSGGTYVLSADKAFWGRTTRVVASIAETQHFVAEELPHIKQRIAEHRKSPRGGGLEIEFEQLMIRANTQEPGLNTEYFAIDRQVLVGNGGERIDVLGVCWPRGDRARSTVLSPALIEVKYGLKGGVDGLVGQLERYYRALAERAEAVAVEAEGILRQKVELGLITGGSEDAIRKLASLPMSRDIRDFRFVVALADYNPNSRLLYLDGLAELPFANQIEVYRLGFGLWQANRVPVAAAEG